MPRGFALPLRPSPTGGVAITEGDEQADKIIRLSLSDNESDNAFQQNLGLGSRMIFDPLSPSFRAQVLSRLFEIFAEYEKLKLFKLVKGSVTWTRGPADGEQTLEFRYINLESDEEAIFVRTFTGEG